MAAKYKLMTILINTQCPNLVAFGVVIFSTHLKMRLDALRERHTEVKCVQDSSNTNDSVPLSVPNHPDPSPRDDFRRGFT